MEQKLVAQIGEVDYRCGSYTQKYITQFKREDISFLGERRGVYIIL